MKILLWFDVALYLGFAAYIVSLRQDNGRFFAGLAIAAVGLALWVTARLQLGKSFAIRAEAKKLVTTGLYSKIRHPIYYFAGIAFTGLFLAWGEPIVFVLFVMGYSGQLARIQREERVLEQAFGEEYRRYKQSTWF